ncbi:hypothetical protein T01_578 [Trichinella spiralis]|uniref:Uncharacterized protein n=1 Tax=Trichinella spiralis TaxID=6334 RepID=A0A0V1BDU4_TRISP|nr:hypothetical protein T01_578 [Trichinella spiralis]
MVWSCERIIPTVTLRLSGLKFTVVGFFPLNFNKQREAALNFPCRKASLPLNKMNLSFKHIFANKCHLIEHVKKPQALYQPAAEVDNFCICHSTKIIIDEYEIILYKLLCMYACACACSAVEKLIQTKFDDFT